MTIIESVEDSLLLRNNVDEGLVSLSKIEYEILYVWAKNNDLHDVINRFGKEYELDEFVIKILIYKAIRLKVLCRKDQITSQSSKLGGCLQYLFVRFIFFINSIFTTNIVPVFDGNLRFFKLFYCDFSHGILKKVITNIIFQKIMKWGIFLIILLELLIIIFSEARLIIPISASVGIPPFVQIIIVIFLIFLCLTIHELAHYFVYKLYGGTSDEIGAGFMYVLFPVLYVNTINVHYWENRRNKIFLSAAGIIVDLSICMAIMILFKFYHTPNIITVSLSYILFYYIFFILINMNFFIPGTDGYYIFSDLIGCNRLFGNSYEEVRHFIGEIVVRKRSRKTLSQLLSYMYYLFCIINITFYWAAFILFFTFPLWIKYI